MTSAPTTPLRQRMIEDMSIRQFGERTQHSYVSVVADFARFLGRSPDRAEPEDLRRYQLHLAAEGASPAKMNAAVSALRFFFRVTLSRQGYGERLATVRKEDRLPEVLSPEEVALLPHCAPSLKHKAALSVAYGCGLQVSEITHLKVGDIDSARMLIRVEQGKGRKDRYVTCCLRSLPASRLGEPYEDGVVIPALTLGRDCALLAAGYLVAGGR
jgi:integrase/recombinase XerD